MKIFAIVALMGASLPISASAQQPAPYKLILSWAQGGIIAVDYPSKSRCDRAMSAVENERDRRIDGAPKQLPDGGIIVGAPWVVYAFCIPG